jgi:hypothetical protein
MLSSPPQLKTTVKTSHRLRFVCNAVGGVANRSITERELLDLYCMATGAAAAYRLWDGIRIKRVSLWAANGAGNASNTCQIEFNNTAGVGGPGFLFNDTVLGLADIAHVSVMTPKGSRAELWLGGGTNTEIFQLTLPQGSVVDVEFEACFADTEAPVAVTAAVAAATLGKVYMRALDNANAVPAILPVGFDFI